MKFLFSLLFFIFPLQDKNERGLVGDFFCGAGGASVGIEEFGVKVDFAVNHDQTAIRLHSRNHPETYHMTEDIFTSEVERFVAGRKVSLIWASPDCTHFSKAKGKTPRKQGIRMLPYAVYFHAAQLHPEVICMENVAEIQGWCPIEDREDVPGFGQPVKSLTGICYKCFVTHMSHGELEPDGRIAGTPSECRRFCDKCQVVRDGYTKCLGYDFDSRELCAADYGAPTTRKRWYAVIRNDHRAIRWPKPTNSKDGVGLPAWIPASSILDLDNYGQSIEEPLHTITTSPGRFGLVSVKTTDKDSLNQADRAVLERAHQVSQFLLLYYGSDTGQGIDRPLRTIVTKDRFSLITVLHDGRVLLDIHLRMLSVEELKRGNGFPDDYDISHDSLWHRIPTSEQVAKIGNAVVPSMSKAIVSANCPYLYQHDRIPFVQVSQQQNGQFSFA